MGIVMRENPTMLAWIDTETTGLDPRENDIIEIAMVLTDHQLVIRSEHHFIIRPQRDNWNLWCAEQHRKSGLIDEIEKRGVAPTEAFSTLTAAVRILCGARPRSVTLAGRTAHFDRSFLAVHAPELHGFLHHRHLDISTIEMFLQRCGVKTMESLAVAPHRALDDIKYAISEYLEYRDLIESHMRGAPP